MNERAERPEPFSFSLSMYFGGVIRLRKLSSNCLPVRGGPGSGNIWSFAAKQSTVYSLQLCLSLAPNSPEPLEA